MGKRSSRRPARSGSVVAVVPLLEGQQDDQHAKPPFPERGVVNGVDGARGRRAGLLTAAAVAVAAFAGPARADDDESPPSSPPSPSSSSAPLFSSFGAKETDGDRMASLVSTTVAVALFAALGSKKE